MKKIERAPRKPGWLNFNVIALVLIIKGLILIFAFQSYQIVTDKPLTDSNMFLGIWKHWDAEHYLRLAQTGYAADGEDRFLITFFPLYPALIGLFQFIFRDYLLSAFVVSGIASIALGLLFRELVGLDYAEKIAQYSVLFLFIFPTAYFLHIPYTESLFLALTVGCFLAARRRSWIVVGILGALACLTRINGLILIPALAFEIWEEYRETRRFNRKWLAVLLIPAVPAYSRIFISLFPMNAPISKEQESAALPTELTTQINVSELYQYVRAVSK
jgi:Gpi18-like mannosyltransferase